jgi:small GTP-binding protein
MGLLKKWRKRRKERYIPLKVRYEPLHEALQNLYEDMSLSIKTSKTKRKEIPKKRTQIIYKTYHRGRYDLTYKIVLFGDRGAERTKLTQKFLTNLFRSDSKMTIGIDFEVKSLEVDHRRVKLQIWDIVGEERFKFLLPTYVRGANGALYIYDDSNYSSLAHIDDWLKLIREEVRKKHFFPIIVVAIVSESEEKRQITTEQGIRMAESRGVDGFIECSVKTGENVEETFEELTRLMLADSRSFVELK